MGCDIYMHIEVKYKGRWEHYSQPDIDRDYDLFSRMANVRNEAKGHPDHIEPISQPRGVPDDVSAIAAIDLRIWDCDAHSASWLTWQELGDLESWLMDRYRNSNVGQRYPFGFLFQNGFDADNMEDLKKEDIEDARAVFWFDN